MIHEILSSDIDYAREMMHASHPDEQILAHLVSRGIEPAKATQLLDDLRHGRAPSAQLPFVPRKPLHAGKHKRSGIPWWFIVIILVFLGALVYFFLEAGSTATQDAIDQKRHELPPPPGK